MRVKGKNRWVGGLALVLLALLASLRVLAQGAEAPKVRVEGDARAWKEMIRNPPDSIH